MRILATSILQSRIKAWTVDSPRPREAAAWATVSSLGAIGGWRVGRAAARQRAASSDVPGVAVDVSSGCRDQPGRNARDPPATTKAPPTRTFVCRGPRRIRTTVGYAGRFTVCSLWPLGHRPSSWIIAEMHTCRQAPRASIRGLALGAAPHHYGDMYKEILYSVEDPVATVTLNRPQSLNAWTQRMAAEFRHAIYQAEHDPAVVGIVVTGAGRAFCAGADMRNLTTLSAGGSVETDNADVAVPDWEFPEDFSGAYTWLMALRKPVIAAINGPIAGMAVPIAMSCDIRFMASDAPLVTAFAERGLIAEWGLSWLLTRQVGTGHALDLLFSSRRVSGTEAAAMGLVQKALPADQVLAHAVDYIKGLAARCSPTSLALMKRQVYSQLTSSLGDAERDALRLMAESFGRPDFKEGVSSFVEKRSPRFERLS